MRAPAGSELGAPFVYANCFAFYANLGCRFFFANAFVIREKSCHEYLPAAGRFKIIKLPKVAHI
jgi:hypothetical protein